MNCPNCLKPVDRVPLVDIVISFKDNEATNEIIELHWHKDCYSRLAPDLLAALRPFAKVADYRDLLAQRGESFSADDIVPKTMEPYEAARAAIAKVEGGE